jgi:hypothetical protein
MKGSEIRMLIGRLVSDWFTETESNAAGRMGLFRILYCFFYLWHLSFHFAGRLSDFPANYWGPMVVADWLPKDLPPYFFQGVESVLVAALVLLLVGYRVRMMTGVILVSGSLLESLYVSLVGDHSMVFLAFYVPFFMFLNNRWGHTYSVDAMLAERAGQARVDSSDSSWLYFLPARCLLVLLLVLFTSAGLLKIFAGGTWLSKPDLLATIMLEKNVKCAVLGIPLNPFAAFIYEHAIVSYVLQYLVIVLESSFVFALLSRRLCRIFLSYALVFHAINALWLIVTFTPILVVYLLFVDWKGLLDRVPFRIRNPLVRVPTSWLVGVVLFAAIALGLSWNSGLNIRGIMNWGGIVNWRTIWYPVLPLAAIVLFRELLDIAGIGYSGLMQYWSGPIRTASPMPPEPR